MTWQGFNGHRRKMKTVDLHNTSAHRFCTGYSGSCLHRLGKCFWSCDRMRASRCQALWFKFLTWGCQFLDIVHRVAPVAVFFSGLVRKISESYPRSRWDSPPWFYHHCCSASTSLMTDDIGEVQKFLRIPASTLAVCMYRWDFGSSNGALCLKIVFLNVFLRFQYEEFYVKNIKIVFPLWFIYDWIYEIYDPALRIIKKTYFPDKKS